jgi:predicted alpha/beta superfamily hydrolase
LDGDFYFATVAETATLMARNSSMGIPGAPGIVPGVIVGIGYPGPPRRGEFSPPGTPSLVPGQPAGGGDAFLSFIANELRPMIEADFHIDTDRQTLMGQSAGGLFVLHALYTRPELFQTYVAGSPALGFWDRPILKGEEELPGKLRAGNLRRHLFVTVGENEEHLVVFQSQSNILQEARNIAARLSAFKEAGLEVTLRVFSGENHFTAPLPLISDTLLHAFPVPGIAED